MRTRPHAYPEVFGNKDLFFLLAFNPHINCLQSGTKNASLQKRSQSENFWKRHPLVYVWTDKYRGFPTSFPGSSRFQYGGYEKTCRYMSYIIYLLLALNNIWKGCYHTSFHCFSTLRVDAYFFENGEIISRNIRSHVEMSKLDLLII